MKFDILGVGNALVDESIPKRKPKNEFVLVLPIAIITIPITEMIIATHTLMEIFSLRNKKPSKAVINGMAAKHKRVIAAEVLVIDQINVVIAIPSPIPPINPDIPIL